MLINFICEVKRYIVDGSFGTCWLLRNERSFSEITALCCERHVLVLSL